jgi:hypothetical protein
LIAIGVLMIAISSLEEADGEVFEGGHHLSRSRL